MVASAMACHPPVFEEDFHARGCETDIDLLSCQLIGDAVVVAVDLDMVVDIDPGLFPFGILVETRGKRFERGFIDGLV